uniref:Putative secreted protein n=1 Tax=Anopheles darlingi TaxID=43151 RepID=A0A2M4D1B5_ANODA
MVRACITLDLGFLCTCAGGHGHVASGGDGVVVVAVADRSRGRASRGGGGGGGSGGHFRHRELLYAKSYQAYSGGGDDNDTDGWWDGWSNLEF